MLRYRIHELGAVSARAGASCETTAYSQTRPRTRTGAAADRGAKHVPPVASPRRSQRSSIATPSTRPAEFGAQVALHGFGLDWVGLASRARAKRTEAEVRQQQQAWGGPLWPAADLITPMAVRVAATLRVADAITAGVTSGPELAAHLAVAADPLVRVLDHLVTAGFLRRDEDGAYALTDAGQWLRDDHPQGIRASIDLEGALGHADTSVVELLHTVRTGEAAFPQRFGRGFWEDLAEHPDRAASFDELMGRGLAADAASVAAAYDWSSLSEVVDVGGGDGSLLIALLRSHPTLRGTVLDLAAPTATAARALSAAGLADRGHAQTGSFFEPLPAGAGGYILSRVIHDWDDDSARRILTNCAQAARPNGKVLVVEDTEHGESVSTEMDLRMLTYCLGQERSLDRLTDLAHQAGLALGTVTPARPRSIVEFLPDQTRRTPR
jgi:SAM-dependent methyltransferase